jgi:hypothetical protein
MVNPPQDILKRYPFELPVGIEHDYADWEKISIFVGYSLTQSRARVKKLVCVSELCFVFHPDRRLMFLHIDQGQRCE